ncbi:hypothetical protein [Mangrovimonas sp. TPBH4]|uniref:hypothetical protein n=1 Tax=Mangrovimonas sp. TPBH4 TaxID=1645914 RepID=UPI0012FA677E|nr:hypothetical protein [Mangrovimonas sp. TPBH4]
MKKLLFLFSILSFTITYAQYAPGNIFFNDGTFSKGLITMTDEGGIKFKKAKDSTVIYYDHSEIEGFDYKGKRLKYVKVYSDEPPRLLNEKIKGKITLYNDDVPAYNFLGTPNTAFGGQPIGSIEVDLFYHFIKMDGEIIPIGIRIKKKHLELFNSCPSLIQKIETKEFKRKHIYDIISYYNEHCGQES